MSTTTTVSEAAEHEVDETVHEHPSDGRYLKIALFLAVVTAAEVATHFFELSTTALVLLLFPMMIVKFATVTGYFMHLKYDNPLFKRVFVFGLVLSIIVYGVVLLCFEFFDDQALKFLQR